jgi:outer membrane protein assembly factor BamB
MRRRTIALIGLAVVVLLALGSGAAYWVANRKTADVHRGDKLPFTLTSDPTAPASAPPTSPLHRFGPSWPLYGLSDARTRNASGLADIHPPYHVTWSASIGFLEYPPVYAKGVLFLYANGGFISARDVFTGKLLWQRALLKQRSDLGQGSPAVHAGVLYLGARDGNIYALSAGTGRTIWRTNVGATMESSPAFDSRYLYMADQNGVVRALALATGKVVWKYQAGGAVKHGPAVVGGRVYFGDYGGGMYCLQASTGHQIWHSTTDGLSSGLRSGNFFSTPAVAYGRVYIGNTDDKLYSFVAATGQVAWTYTMPNWAYGSPAVSDGRVFATSFDGTFAAFNARTGAVLWQHRLPFKSLASPTVIGPYVYVTDLGPSPGSRGRTFGYDPRTGKLVWRFGDGKYATPIAAAGRLVVAGATHIYVLRTRTAAP